MFKYLKDFIDSILNMHDDDHNHDIEHKKLKEWVKNELKQHKTSKKVLVKMEY